MANYKYSAIAQNTYKFVNEVTIGNIGDIQDPKSPRLGFFKVIKGNNTKKGRVLYSMPKFGNDTTSSVSNIEYKIGEHQLSSSDSVHGAYGRMLHDATGPVRHGIPNTPETYSCKVGEDVFVGFKNSTIVVYWISDAFTTSKTYLNHSYEETDLPKCKINIVKYDAATSTVIAQSYDLEQFIDVAGTKSSTASSYNTYVRLIYMEIPKADEDLILAITVEYPKYDIKFSGSVSGLKYSIDDGLTYHDITNGLELNQVEHVLFKNTATIQKTITVKTDEDPIVINAECVYTLTPTENGTWYFS